MQPSKYTTRLKAFLIDYLLIIGYACLLFGITYLVTGGEFIGVNPLQGQLIGFVTLTLPVVLYFIIAESGKHSATIGKRKFRLRITDDQYWKASLSRIIVRNVVKFLPWEIAHTFIHQLMFYVRREEDVPTYVMAGLIIPQVVVLIYDFTPLMNKRRKSVYDFVAGTVVVKE